jgi:hypothetical protein
MELECGDKEWNWSCAMNEERPGIRIETVEIKVPRRGGDSYSIANFRKFVETQIPVNSVPVRFVVSKSDADAFHCEVGSVIHHKEYKFHFNHRSIFDFNKRTGNLPKSLM